MSPWLSILIPVYNVEQYLAECLNSVLSQIDDSIEILVLDDKSTDNSLNLLNQLVANSTHPITVLQHEKNSGLSAARNTLLEAAKGNYVWFLDSDDALAPNAVAQLHEIVSKHSPDLIMCDYEIWREKPRKKAKKRKKERHVHSFAGAENELCDDSDELFKGLYTKGKLHTWSKISKRSLWQNNLRFPVGKYFEDMATTYHLAFCTKSYFYCPQVWVKYRQRSGSILATLSLDKMNDMFDALSLVLPLWSKKTPPLKASARIAFICFCVNHYWSALKNAKKMGGDYSNLKLLYRNRVLEASQLNKYQLILTLLVHGKFVRLLRFLR